MRIASLIAGLSVAMLSAGVVQAKPAYVPSTLNLRAAPGTTNEIVAKIPGGSLVDVGDCSGNWCAVTWQDKKGFSIQSGIDLSGRVPPRRTATRRYYRGDWVPVDPPGFYGPPPVYVAPPPPPPYYYPYRYRRYWGRPYWGSRWHFSRGW
ncbi:MAG: SH3 domain-containing protein [Pseudolabrys sp.]